MSKNKPAKSNLSMASPKGSLIAQISNLRRELKESKQLKKQSVVLGEKPMREIFFHANKKSPEQKCQTSLGNTAKQRFFKSPKEDSVSGGKSKVSHLAVLGTQKSMLECQTKERASKQNIQKPIMEQEKEPMLIKLNEIWLKEKDRKLKLDIELNKLRKTILKLGPEEIAEQLNCIISLVNVSNHDYANRIEVLEKNQKTDESDESLLMKRQEEEIESLTNKIIESQDQINQLKNQLKLKTESQQSLENLNETLTQDFNQLRTRSEALDTIAKELDQKTLQLQEQNKILQNKLLKKQEHLLLLHEDVNYLRIQTDNYKSQKKQFADLYENTLSELRQFKRTKNLEIQKLQQEKDKWEKQCKLRRNESQEITALEQQKIALMKELSEMRHLANLKNSELQEKKALQHENQKRVIQMQSEVYKLRTEVQTLRNQKEFAEFENEKINQEFQDLKRYTRKNQSIQKGTKNNEREKCHSKSTAKIQNQEETTLILMQKRLDKNDFDQEQLRIEQNQERRQVYKRKLKEKQEKLRALEDIHSLIKKHRNQMQIL